MKPMLAATLKDGDESKLEFPLLASPKLDGVRCILKDGVALSRTFKLIPNRHVQEFLSNLPKNLILDGELIVGSPCDQNVMQSTSSGIMTRDGIPNFRYYVFDHIPEINNTPFKERYMELEGYMGGLDNLLASRVSLLKQSIIMSMEDLIAYEEFCIKAGYEGIMIRGLKSPYKFGRATLREGYLIKLKRFLDAEASIIGINELMHNENELDHDNFGYAKRSSMQGNLRPGNTMGSIRVKDLESGLEFDIGTGFDSELRKNIWGNRHELMKYATIIKYKYFPSGIKTLPRFPVFLGFRDPIDL